MNAEQINTLNHDQIRIWLERALNGQELLPRLTPDESDYLGILRLEKSLNPAARLSLREGVLNLLRQFCGSGLGNSSFIQELLSLASSLRQPETPSMLADLALRFPKLRETALEVRFAVLGVLVDASPPQPANFWERILEQDPANYASLALAGVLGTNPLNAVKLLPAMPDTERAGQAAALNLDLAWDDLLPRDRPTFVEQIQNRLRQCGQQFAVPVKVWAETKVSSPASIANPRLVAAITIALGAESGPKTLTPKLGCLPLAA